MGDAQYHLRRAQWTLANYPRVPRFDPYINFPSRTTKLEHMGRFGLNTVSSLPLVDEITTR